ncbi:unnamed protein product [Amoebophrya sp. A120]|nr:unnamed protein product [Amoebophrya sp. A120]|eukprot:GSA120T00021070001.1
MMLNRIKTESETRSSELRKIQDRKKNILIFIQNHLQHSGYLTAAQAVAKDTNLQLDSLDCADNMDLDVVFQEFETYYEMKFGKKPKLLKDNPGGALAQQGGGKMAKNAYRYGMLPAVGGATGGGGGAAGSSGAPSHGAGGASAMNPEEPGSVGAGGPPSATNNPAASKRRLSTRNAASGGGGAAQASSGGSGVVVGTTVSSSSSSSAATDGGNGTTTAGVDNSTGSDGAGAMNACDISIIGQNAKNLLQTASQGPGVDHFVNRVRKPMPLEYAYNPELKELATLIERDICVKNPNVQWTDIVGLERPKQLVKEAVVLPMKYPQLFQGILAPWRGILLFGPPGTGKTLLAKAIATECNVTFFNVSASTIVSKWRGESEKLIRVLFDLAAHHSPSTIFIDELDSVMCARGGGDEHEGSRRLKTELLIQMDGLNSMSNKSTTATVSATDGNKAISQPVDYGPQVFLLAASNLPWDLDPAMLRRLEKRILVPLPCAEARKSLLKRFLSGRVRWEDQQKRDRQPSDRGSASENGKETTAAADGGPERTGTASTALQLLDPEVLTEKLAGWSGSDVRLLCKEIAMHPLRRCLAKLENAKDLSQLKTLTEEEQLVTSSDVAQGLTRVHAAPLTCDLNRYVEWNEAFGST